MLDNSDPGDKLLYTNRKNEFAYHICMVAQKSPGPTDLSTCRKRHFEMITNRSKLIEFYACITSEKPYIILINAFKTIHYQAPANKHQLC